MNRKTIFELFKLEYKSTLQNKFMRFMVLFNLIWMPSYILYNLSINDGIWFSIFSGCVLSAIFVNGYCSWAFAKDGYYYEAITGRFIIYYKYALIPYN